MAQLRATESATDPCCAPEVQASCCESSAKADCCGESHASGSCSCGAGTAGDSPGRDVREQTPITMRRQR
jgi:hypothetical protein